MWQEKEEYEEQDVMMNQMYWIDMDSTQWVWNLEWVWNIKKNIENCSKNMWKTVKKNVYK